MPGTPPTSPNLGLARYAQSDAAVFATDINAIIDLLDTLAVKHGAIVNADINAAAAIAKSKLAALAIVNADIDAAAAIAQSKLALDADPGAHASRHEYGDADALPAGSVDVSQIAPSTWPAVHIRCTLAALATTFSPTTARTGLIAYTYDAPGFYRCTGTAWEGGPIGAATAAAGIQQNGVIAAGDLLVGTISISTSTGALTFTPATTTQSGWVMGLGGMLVAVSYSAGATTITPVLPASGKYAVIGAEIDANGTITLTKGADTATQLNTATLIASNSPATTAGQMRIADFAVWNSAGVFNFGDHTTTATRGVNWIDRRPNARGGTYANAAPNAFTNTQNDTVRLECTGTPLLVHATASPLSAPQAGAGVSVTIDGVALLSVQSGAGTANVLSASGTRLYTPTAGSHVFVFALTAGGTGGNYYWWLREQASTAFGNGTA